MNQRSLSLSASQFNTGKTSLCLQHFFAAFHEPEKAGFAVLDLPRPQAVASKPSACLLEEAAQQVPSWCQSFQAVWIQLLSRRDFFAGRWRLCRFAGRVSEQTAHSGCSKKRGWVPSCCFLEGAAVAGQTSLGVHAGHLAACGAVRGVLRPQALETYFCKGGSCWGCSGWDPAQVQRSLGFWEVWQRQT